MVIFRVSENINIKTTDGTLVKYSKLKNPSNLLNETIYISTYEDFKDLRRVFTNVGEKYKARVFHELKIRQLNEFPKELGVLNPNEYSTTQNLDLKYKEFNYIAKNQVTIDSLYLNEKKADLHKQIEGSLKEDISLIVIGNPGFSISQMICACTALRVLHEKLSKKFKSVKIDLYLNASENKYYSRDKMIFSNQTFINKVSALAIDVKEFCKYDFFIDLSSATKRTYFRRLSYIDAWFYKFGIDYTKIDKTQKYNTINIDTYKPSIELVKEVESIKRRGKILLFHPYSANIKKSIPKEIASNLLKELLEKMPAYTIVSAVRIDNKIDDDRYVDLSSNSKNFLDFSYIISNMSKIITVNTATYHIADAFFIPTVVIVSDEKENQNLQKYPFAKVIYVEDESKSLSKFIFSTDALLVNKFKAWTKLKSSRIIKLLESF